MRIAFDLDGVLADFAGAYDAIARRLRDESGSPDPASPAEADAPSGKAPIGMARRIWREIESTENFWTTLEPLEPDLIAGIHRRALREQWDVFFVTQRPGTKGESVQRQTQRWLHRRGYPLPAVIPHRASRGRLAAALDLDFLVDDTVQHCVDVREASGARPILVCTEPDAVIETNAERLGIAICRSATEALEVIGREQSGRVVRVQARRGLRR